MQIIHMYSVIGNIAYLMTKHLTIEINKSFSWYILYISYQNLVFNNYYFVKNLFETLMLNIVAQMNRVRVLYIVMPVT
jgi:hypothetical protein